MIMKADSGDVMTSLAFQRLQVVGRGLRPRSYSSNVNGTSKQFLLYTAGTPNGRKVSILMEEMKAKYGIDYDVQKLDISTNIQKEPWYTKLNPNGRIPTLVDRTRDDFTIFETAAILLYIVQHYDKEFKFCFNPQTQPNEYSVMLQWVFWAHGGLGPMQGQSNHFQRFAPEDIPYAKKRYLDETKRLFDVLQARLREREYLAGPGQGVYSVADINAFPWALGHNFAGIPTLDGWPDLKGWIERVSARPSVQAGLSVP